MHGETLLGDDGRWSRLVSVLLSAAIVPIVITIVATVVLMGPWIPLITICRISSCRNFEITRTRGL